MIAIKADGRSVHDLTGLRCPDLARRVRKILARASRGEVLELVCADPLAELDVTRAVEQAGNEVLSRHANESGLRLVVHRSAGSASSRAP